MKKSQRFFESTIAHLMLGFGLNYNTKNEYLILLIALCLLLSICRIKKILEWLTFEMIQRQDNPIRRISSLKLYMMKCFKSSVKEGEKLQMKVGCGFCFIPKEDLLPSFQPGHSELQVLLAFAAIILFLELHHNNTYFERLYLSNYLKSFSLPIFVLIWPKDIYLLIL